MNGSDWTPVLDSLCPMHLMLDADGVIRHAGPTICKLRPETGLPGQAFLDVFQVKRPRAIHQIEDLHHATDKKMHLTMRGPPKTDLKGIMVPLPGQSRDVIVNLSFGISILDGVRDYALTNSDFAATDLAIEMLYLVEAKSAAMEATRQLNQRLQGARIAAEQQAFTDTLTGLANRRAMDTVLSRLIAGRGAFALMHIDLDFFKAVNDTLGHAAGDHVLRQVAQVMIEETRKTDTVARVGGDEFTVILPDVGSLDLLRRIGERIIARLEQPIPFDDQTCLISASIGTVWVQENQRPTAQALLSDADIALYASKHAGRSRQTFYVPELRLRAQTAAPAPERGAARTI